MAVEFRFSQVSMSERGPRGSVTMAVGVTIVFWASAFVAVRSAAPHFTPGGMALLRFATASGGMGGDACFGKLWRPRRGEILPLAAAGLLGIAVYHSLFNYAA